MKTRVEYQSGEMVIGAIGEFGAVDVRQ